MDNEATPPKPKKQVRIFIRNLELVPESKYPDTPWMVCMQTYSRKGGRPSNPAPLIKGHPAGLVCAITPTPLLCKSLPEALEAAGHAVELYKASDLDIWDLERMEIVVESLT